MEAYQGDILKVSGIKFPIFVASKDFFNSSNEIIGCPIMNKCEEGALHIHIKFNDEEGYVVCENLRLLDLNVRKFAKLAHLDSADRINIVDAIQSIFDWEPLKTHRKNYEVYLIGKNSPKNAGILAYFKDFRRIFNIKDQARFTKMSF